MSITKDELYYVYICELYYTKTGQILMARSICNAVLFIMRHDSSSTRWLPSSSLQSTANSLLRTHPHQIFLIYNQSSSFIYSPCLQHVHLCNADMYLTKQANYECWTIGRREKSDAITTNTWGRLHQLGYARLKTNSGVMFIQQRHHRIDLFSFCLLTYM